MSKIGKRGDIEWDTLIGWIIAIVVLVVILAIFFLVLKPKGISAFEYLKNLFKFGR